MTDLFDAWCKNPRILPPACEAHPEALSWTTDLLLRRYVLQHGENPEAVFQLDLWKYLADPLEEFGRLLTWIEDVHRYQGQPPDPDQDQDSS